ncbi:MAG: ATP-binding cassette domain-containing protein [Bacteroidales bacterium]|nr:ATP-binding cassette domain-containing protein [Bacteroidales bacterium]
MFLETRHIEKNFGTFRALDDINIGVREGTIFGLLGPNGAGKTTLIRLINRIARPDGGEILMDGRAVSDDDVRRIGYLPEERGLYKKMRVGEQAVYLARLKGLSRREAEGRLIRWFERFGIESWWKRPVEELSKGMQQKVQFIVTVLHQPRLLIFDEPFSGFDPVNATMLKDEILRLRKAGATVILSTHNMASVEELCDDIALINNAKVVLSGSVNEIRRSFSNNTFEAVTRKSDQKLQLPDSFDVVSSTCEDDIERLQVSLPKNATANDLIATLLNQCQIVSLNEMLPSMNDIFVEAVKKGGAR